jgi:hypothetical protein
MQISIPVMLGFLSSKVKYRWTHTFRTAIIILQDQELGIQILTSMLNEKHFSTFLTSHITDLKVKISIFQTA